MEHKSESGFVCVYRTPSHDQLAIIKSLLQANKIPYVIDNENFASLSGVADGAVNFGIMVERSYSEDAKELLSKIINPASKKDNC